MLPHGAEGSSGLRTVVGVLSAHRWMIVLVPLVVAAAAFGYSTTRTPGYEASAQLVIDVQNRRSVFDSEPGANREPSRAIQTEIQVINGRAVRDAVLEEVDEPASVTARAVGLTDVVEITASSTDAELAAETANAYADAYLEHRRQRAVSTFVAAGEEIQGKLADLQSQIDALDRAITQRGEDGSEVLVAQRDALVAQHALFGQRLDQLQVDASLQEASAELIAPAEVPSDPVSPQPVRDAVLAAAIGLFLAVAAAFVLERLDETIQTKADVERTVPNLPVLATIPSVPGHSGEASLVPHGSVAAEAYRTLRTAVKFISLDRQVTTVQVTSPMAAEGKSTTVANLALMFAEAGERVLVVCCDLRRPSLYRFFGLENRTGFTSVLLGHTDVWGALQHLGDRPNVAVLASGPPPPNPSELLASQATAHLFKQLKGTADIVVVDSPPVLPVTDAAVLAQFVDATILVSASGQTSATQLSEAVEQLHAVHAPLVGVVVNRDEEGSRYGGGYAYGRQVPVAGRWGRLRLPGRRVGA